MVSHSLFFKKRRRHRRGKGKATDSTAIVGPETNDTHRPSLPSILDAPHLGQQSSLPLPVLDVLSLPAGLLAWGAQNYHGADIILVLVKQWLCPLVKVFFHHPLGARISSSVEPKALGIESMNLPCESIGNKGERDHFLGFQICVFYWPEIQSIYNDYWLKVYKCILRTTFLLKQLPLVQTLQSMRR